MNSLCITPNGIPNLFNNFKLSTSAGEDGINSKILKCTKGVSSVPLSDIFSKSLSVGLAPNDWKIGKAVPIHKGGEKSYVNNYRHIWLTSVSCKLHEHVIHSELVHFLEQHDFFLSHLPVFEKGNRAKRSFLNSVMTFTSWIILKKKLTPYFLIFLKYLITFPINA